MDKKQRSDMLRAAVDAAIERVRSLHRGEGA